ncbi:MAG: hypothetical protein KGL11_11375 [Alphaproteobacteria bacterium]|nr:hypothetical protein [Alphaproteobacteria bacterium]
MDDTSHAAMRPAKTAARTARRAPIRAIWNWVAPWFTGVLLAGATLLGFFTASGAEGPDTYAIGLVTAGLALVALGWLVKSTFDERTGRWPLKILAERPESLVLLVALLTAIGIGGLFLAADAHGAAKTAGYALFVVCLLVIAANLKHYYDERDSRRPDGGSAPD